MLVWKSAPGWTLLNLILIVFQAILPLVSLYLLKRIIDTVTNLISSGQVSSFQPIVLWIVLALGVALLTILARSLAELANQAQSFVVTDKVSDIIHAQSMLVDLEYYEDPRYYDTLHRAQREATSRPISIVNGLVQLGQNTISLLGISALIFAFNWLLALLLVAVALPGAMIRLVYARKLYHFEREQTENDRRAWYYHWMLSDSTHAKEIRLFNLGELFRERFRQIRKQLREGRLAITKRRIQMDFFTQTLSSAAIYGTLAYVSLLAINGTITLGDLVIYYTGFQMGLGFLQAILRSVTSLYEDTLFVTNLYGFLDLKPRVQTPKNPTPIPTTIQRGVSFNQVSFRYPSSEGDVLQQIDLTLSPGEVIALVGENGSGKTTLIKLLCRLYDPSAGEIVADGADIRQFDPLQWRRGISVIFQDYVHYYLTAWENIWFGDICTKPEIDKIQKAAMLSGADSFLSQLPKGYDTPLGYWFRTGHELSIGEWQKVALARAFLRDSWLVVLDEPTSSLDPLAEEELFLHFRTLIQGRSAILISHRFSTVQMADCIYVIDKGRIVEYGDHQKLLKLNGHYARLYLAQAQYYQMGGPIEH